MKVRDEPETLNENLADLALTAMEFAGLRQPQPMHVHAVVLLLNTDADVTIGAMRLSPSQARALLLVALGKLQGVPDE